MKGADDDTYPVKEEELYDIVADPGEQEDLASSHPDLARTLREELASWEKFEQWKNTRYERNEEKRSPEVTEHLRSLGYVH